MSVRTKEQNVPHVVEAIRRAKYKFPGRQNIIISKKWGFTNLTREEYAEKKAEGKLIKDGINVRVWNNKGPLAPVLKKLTN